MLMISISITCGRMFVTMITSQAVAVPQSEATSESPEGAQRRTQRSDGGGAARRGPELMMLRRACAAVPAQLAARTRNQSAKFLSTSAGALSTNGSLPVIEFDRFLEGTASARLGVAQEMRKACETEGFLILTGTESLVPNSVIDPAWQSMWDYFDLPEEEKRKVPMSDDDPYGYSFFGEEILSRGRSLEEGVEDANLPDLKESFTLGPSNPLSGMPPRRWPAQPADFQENVGRYYGAMEGLADQVLQALAMGLDLPVLWFQDKMDRHCSALRCINYPDLPGYEPKPGQFRASAHSDYGAITILRQSDAEGSLQVKHRRLGWLDAQYIEGSFVVNIGDLFERWTNRLFHSSLHRVAVPPPHPKSGSCRRQSAAFFVNLNADALVECIPTCHSPDNPPKYAPIRAMEHLMEKHLASTQGTQPTE